MRGPHDICPDHSFVCIDFHGTGCGEQRRTAVQDQCKPHHGLDQIAPGAQLSTAYLMEIAPSPWPLPPNERREFIGQLPKSINARLEIAGLQ